MKKIYLISNDKIWSSNKNYTSNNDLNNIITCLNKKYEVNLICRKSSTKLDFELIKNLKYLNLKKITEKKINILLISITPYIFFVFFYLTFIKGNDLKGFVYLRSDGFLEYKYRYGFFGYFFYYLMFSIIKKNLKIISCSKNFTNVNVKEIIHPSELEYNWFKNNDIEQKYETDFLYVGRFKKDKGSIYLAELFKNILVEYNLKIVGTDKLNIPKKFYSKNIDYIDSISNVNDLINIYDSSKIFILPSYIEGFPKVISESLARLKPVIIFEDIKYVINGRSGIFVCKRDEKNLRKTIKYIFKNYGNIQKKIKNNYFFTKDNFKNELLKSLKNEF